MKFYEKNMQLKKIDNIKKSGFSLSSIDKYFSILDNIGINIVLVENKDTIINEFKDINLVALSKEKLISIIERYKNCL